MHVLYTHLLKYQELPSQASLQQSSYTERTLACSDTERFTKISEKDHAAY